MAEIEINIPKILMAESRFDAEEMALEMLKRAKVVLSEAYKPGAYRVVLRLSEGDTNG